MSQALLEKIDSEIQKKLQQKNLKMVRRLGGRKKMLSFVN